MQRETEERKRESLFSALDRGIPYLWLARQEVGSGERKCRMTHDNTFYSLLNSTAQLGQSLLEIPSSLSATVGVKDLETNVTCKGQYKMLREIN